MSGDKRKAMARVRHKERKRLAGKCEAKVRYTFVEAQLYEIRYRQRKYKCPICRGWHLTGSGP